MSGTILLVGGMGCGKSKFAANMTKAVNKKSIIVYDVNNEYKDYPNRYVPLQTNIDTFIDILTKTKNAIVLMEDMTAFLSNRGRSAKMVEVMQAHRHTGNTMIVFYHSMGDIPKYIMRLSSKVVIFKTNDDEMDIHKRFSKKIITEAWKEVQEKAKVNPFYSSMPPPKNTTPDYKVVSLY